MADEKGGGGPSNERRGGSGGGNRDRDRRGGGRRDNKRKGPRKGGGFGKGPPHKERVETYESLKELTRGEGFRIDKYVLAEKKTHKPVKTEYRLTREGLKGVHAFPRLVDAQTAATAPLPEPEPEVTEELAVASDEAAVVEATDTPAAESVEAASDLPDAPSEEHAGSGPPAADDLN